MNISYQKGKKWTPEKIGNYQRLTRPLSDGEVDGIEASAAPSIMLLWHYDPFSCSYGPALTFSNFWIIENYWREAKCSNLETRSARGIIWELRHDCVISWRDLSRQCPDLMCKKRCQLCFRANIVIKVCFACKYVVCKHYNAMRSSCDATYRCYCFKSQRNCAQRWSAHAISFAMGDGVLWKTK